MKCFIHADLDAFYASVEQLDHPEYRGKAVIVGGLPGDRRSVVSTASYEARKFGVHSAMPLAQAVKLCPKGIYLRGRMKRYQEKSQEIMAIFADFSPDVQQLSVDEAFIDISGMEGLFGPPAGLAQKLKNTIREKTGLTVSVGLASNKYIAKIASGMSKPDGLFVIPLGDEEKFMRSLPVSKIWGAGEKTQELFKKHSIRTCEELSRLSLGVLTSIFGNAFGLFLYRAVRGEPAEVFDEGRGTHSMSAERTFDYDLYDEFAIETALLDICQTLIWRLLDCEWQSRTISIKIRYEDFSTEGVRETSQDPVSTLNDLYKRLQDLFHKKYRPGRGVRLLGAGLMNLESFSPRQSDLFNTGDEKERRLEQSILEINKKFPNAAVKRGRTWLADE
ncbi:DNA polymerase IV [Leadbettera azotonutricia]|uniref:DNA polymerase IV n=1 Tax=Leadbettera azotonutricia (strain ATCC BAA-888 / DSM 13862 / ZAS-9) TaxID=545695 RepID=F5Y737_LEAAZ|nr:DNA polymerase IV [Leadbettera azotonutricia]AEF80385.1 DNA polymerase IV [Leadbettera azotonutricia ZAS-9]